MQKYQEYGELWSDEGVYQIAKELQFLHDGKFKIIFLGLRGFHIKKVILTKIAVRDVSCSKRNL